MLEGFRKGFLGALGLRQTTQKRNAVGGLQTRMYAGARPSRLSAGFGSSAGNSSADSELSTSLTMLRSRSRQVMRDAPYAKRTRTLIVNNVVGSGIGLQCQVMNSRGKLAEAVNADIERAFAEWTCADACHTGGALAFGDFERTCMSEVVTAGEVFVRLHYRKFGRSKIPLGLELIEAERLADDFVSPSPSSPNEIRMGIEVDEFGRALAYWFRQRHPGELRFNGDQTVKLVRVPASDILHLRIVDRWPQTRGEPWLHAVIRKLNDMDEYTGAELQAARLSANYFATVERDDEMPESGDALPGAETLDDGSKQVSIEPGVIEELAPGAKLNFHSPNRPNAALDPFMRYMVREYAVGANVSYAAQSGDYSQSNYSSSRLALLDDRDCWRALQQWFVRSFRKPLHEVWMRQAAMARAIPTVSIERFALHPDEVCAARFKCRGWSWIDPASEVESLKEAVKAGFTTVSRVIEQTQDGLDIEDIVELRKRELEMFEAAGFNVDTTVVDEPEAVAPIPVQDETEDDDEDGDSPAARRARIQLARSAHA